MATKKTGTKRTKSAAQSADSGNRQLKAVICFAVAMFLMFVVFIKGGNVWEYMHNFMFGVFGITAYFYPFMLGFVAVMIAMNKATGAVGIKVGESSAMVVLLGGCIDVITTKADEALTYGEHISKAFTIGWESHFKNGGFLGALIGNPIYRAFTKVPAIITIILLMLVLLMIVTGTTLIGLFKTVSKPVKAVSEQAGSAYKARAEREDREVNAADSSERHNGRIKVIKGFDVDLPVDDIPKERKRNHTTLDEKQKKLVDSYYDGEEENKPDISAQQETIEMGVNEALDAAKTEMADDGVASDSEEAPERITVDFEKETNAVTEEINAAVTEKHYKFPPYDLLKSSSTADKLSRAEIDNTANRLVETLKSFGVETRIVDVSKGPTVTRYELQPCAGVKISKITGLADDIALNLAAAGVRIEAPIPNKAAVGIEVPNKTAAMVGVREIIESTAFSASKSKLTVAMGKDIGGNVIIGDIAKMPHGLIAGATGSGKSVCINSFIISILYKASPEDVKLLMIDPKVVELGVYNGIPHLLVPVVTEPRKAAGALGWAVSEMEKRYQMFADRGVRDIEGYNKFISTLIDEPEVKKMPHIVIIIDELADLMMTAPREVEDSINRIAAKARAAGIHLLIATQRPSVDVVTGVIKANIPTRIAFAVSSQVDSRTILDTAGAEKLLGRGDMLFNPVGSSKPKRVQGCFVSDEEVERVTEFVKSGKTADYDDDIMVEIERQAALEKQKKTGLEEDAPDADPMLEDAIKVVVEAGLASTSLLQRKLKLGYARAARIVDEMEQRGIVGPFEGSKPRKVLITKEQLMEREASSED